MYDVDKAIASEIEVVNQCLMLMRGIIKQNAYIQPLSILRSLFQSLINFAINLIYVFYK